MLENVCALNLTSFGLIMCLSTQPKDKKIYENFRTKGNLVGLQQFNILGSLTSSISVAETPGTVAFV